MLKQFSVPQKIFGTTTLLLGLCYTGFLIYVQPAFAVDPIWLWYNAQVWDIYEVSGNTWRNQTRHRVRYDNTANNVNKTVGIRTRAEWVHRYGPYTLRFENPQADQDNHDETCLAGAVGTILLNKHIDKHISNNGTWQAKAYTNLLSINDWLDGHGWNVAAGADTDQRSRAAFPPDHPVTSDNTVNGDQ